MPLMEQYAQLAFDGSNFWDEQADIVDVIAYCRSSKRLFIPTGWREVLPKAM